VQTVANIENNLSPKPDAGAIRSIRSMRYQVGTKFFTW